MPLDLNAFPPEVRAKQIATGRRFSASETLEQANLTLNAYTKHGVELKTEGFSAADRQRLIEARDMLIAAGVGRKTARAERKSAGRAYGETFDSAKRERLRARTILENSAAALRERNDSQAREAVRSIDVVLQQTSALEDDGEALSAQLDLLAGALGKETVREEAAERGGPESVVALGTAASSLRQTDQQSALPAGTPEETQRIHQIGGIIVDVVRRARRAAISASQHRADPAMARAFQLRGLYGSRAAEADEEQEESDTEPGGDPEMTPVEPPASKAKGQK